MAVYSFDEYKKKKKNNQTDVAPVSNYKTIEQLANEKGIQISPKSYTNIRDKDVDALSPTKNDDRNWLEKTGDFLGTNIMAGITSFNDQLFKTIQFLNPWRDDEDNPITKAANFYIESNKEQQEKQENVNKNLTDNKIVNDVLDKVGNYGVEGVVNALPQAIMGFMSGGASLSAMAGTTASQVALEHTISNTIINVAKNPAFWGSFVQMTGTSYYDAKEEGASDLEASTVATLNGLLGSIVEIGGGLEELPQLQRGIKAWVSTMFDEGKEEVVQGAIEGVLKKGIYDNDKKVFAVDDDEAVISLKRGLEEFIGGAVVGGILGVGEMGASNVIEHKKAGRSLRTDLTENETKVYESEVNRIADYIKAQTGKEMTFSEKKKLQREVLKKVKGGDVSIENIRKALGENVDISKDYYLQDSFRQEYLRGEAYSYKKTDNQAENDIRESARTSGMNNTRKTRNLVDFVTKVASEKGMKVRFANSGQIENMGKAKYIKDKNGNELYVDKDGNKYWYNKKTNKFMDENYNTVEVDKNELKNYLITNGFVDTDGTIYINPNSRHPLEAILGHEVNHTLEGAKGFNELQNMIIDYVKGKKLYEPLMVDIRNNYNDKSEGEQHIELSGDVVGQVLFTDDEFIKNLSAKQPNIFKRIYEEIKHFCKLATAGSSEARQLEKIRHKFSKVYREMNQNAEKVEGEAVEYSVSKDEYAPTFYSQMGKVIDNVKQAKLGATSVIPMLKGKGVKAEEIKWSGIEEFLDGKKSVTKQELQDFMAKNSLEIEEETIKGVTDSERIELFENFFSDINKYYDFSEDVVEEYFDYDNNFNYGSFKKAVKELLNDEEIDQDAYDSLLDIGRTFSEQANSSTRWGDYTLKGGENYRELLFKMPGSDYTNQSMNVHWGERGVLAHARIQDMNTLDGKSMLFVEEIQSDWHNAGHKQGYDNNFITEEEAYNIRMNAKKKFMESEYGNSVLLKVIEYENIRSKDKQIAYNYLIIDPLNYMSEINDETDGDIWFNDGEAKAVIDLDKTLKMAKNRKGSVPDAPFKNSYTDFVMKRLIRMAAEQGYDSIGWTTADIQSKRWSEQYEEGYKIEYDQDIPKFLNKYGKKWGAKVGKATLDNFSQNEVWSLDITDAMKESVLYEGQPMYSASRNITPISDSDYKTMESFFGTTKNYNVAGYLLTDGNMLDFSGKHWGDDYSTTRQVDHRDIWDATEPSDMGGTDAMVNMIGNGNIRLMPENGGINLAVMPTAEQLKTLRGYINHFRGEILVDIDSVGGDTIQSFEYNKGTSSSKIISDLRNYFENGTIPQQSELGKYRYSVSKSKAMIPDLAPLNTRKTTGEDVMRVDRREELPFSDAPLSIDELADNYYKGNIEAPEDIEEEYAPYQVGSDRLEEAKASNMEAFKQAASEMLTDIDLGIKGTRGVNTETFETYGQTRQIASDIANLLDSGYSYKRLKTALNNIIKGKAKNSKIYNDIFDTLYSRLTEGYYNTLGYEVPPSAEFLNAMKLNDAEALQGDLQERANQDALDYNEGDYEEIAESDIKYNAPALVFPVQGKVANVVERKPQDKKKGGFGSLVQALVNKGHWVDQFAKATGNKKITYLYDKMLSVQGEGHHDIGVAQSDNEGNIIGKSINEIWKPVEDAKLMTPFQDYLLHLHNIDRFREGKPVFGYQITDQMSQNAVDDYDKKYPEFKAWAKDINTYNRNQLSNMVDAQITSADVEQLLNDTYSNYVRIHRDIDKSGNAVISTYNGKIELKSPIKKAKGGNQDIFSLKDSMALQTLEVKNAIRRNQLALEIYNTLKANKRLNIIKDGNKKLISKSDSGIYSMTAFVDGNPVEFEITEELYNSLSNDDKYKLKDLEERLGSITTPIQKLSAFQRNLLTVNNPIFIATNFFKDIGDAPFNSKYAKTFYKNYVRAAKEIMTNGDFYKKYLALGGEQNTYFDYDKGFKKEKGKYNFVENIAKVNEAIEMMPRLAEFISTLEAGGDIMEAMYNAAEITTNFKRGGDITKAINRNGANFLNASVQGLSKQIRNVTDAKGFKGYVNLITKACLFGVLPSLLNNLLLGDDEDYEELSDYVKDSYFVFKTGDGEFIRIPKGRVMAVMGAAARRTIERIGGDEDAYNGLGQLAINNVAPNNPLTDNLLAPFLQVASNTTWYGGDLVPTRLQDELPKNQYDETTDSISKFIGRALGISPIKVNYIIDQYSGGIGDVFLPMITPEATNGSDSIIGKALAPAIDKFTANSTFDNKYSSEFYAKSRELTAIANDSESTEEDKLKAKYMSEVSSEVGKLYAQIREVQNSDLINSEKYKEVSDIRNEINELTKYALENYERVSITSNYATVGDRSYRGKDGTWSKITDEQKEKQTEAMSKYGISATTYWSNTEEYNFALANPETYEVARAIDSYQGYRTYRDEINNIKGKDRKKQIINYVSSLDLSLPQKAMLIRTEYKSFNDYNTEIVRYVNSLNVSDETKIMILEKQGFKVNNGRVSW